MIKRLTWFVTGAVAGVGSVLIVGRRIKRRVSELAPVRVAERALDKTKESVSRLKRAATDGRDAMREREEELKSRVLGTQVVSDSRERMPSAQDR